MCGTYAVNITLDHRSDADHETWAEICDEAKYNEFTFRYWPGMVAIKGSTDWTVYPAKSPPPYRKPWSRWVITIPRCTAEDAEELRQHYQRFMENTQSENFEVKVTK